MSQLGLFAPTPAPPVWTPQRGDLAWFRDASEGGRWASILVLRVEGDRVRGAGAGSRSFLRAELWPRPPITHRRPRAVEESRA